MSQKTNPHQKKVFEEGNFVLSQTLSKMRSSKMKIMRNYSNSLIIDSRNISSTETHKQQKTKKSTRNKRYYLDRSKSLLKN